MVNGLCSVIMPAYNAERYIREAIESVLVQSYPNFELLIIDDNSSDGTKNIVYEYTTKDKRIFAYFNKKNCGCAASRNIGLSLCRGEYVAFIDSDDIWLPQKLEKQIIFLTSHEQSMVYTAYEIINSDGRVVKTRSIKEKLLFNNILQENIIIFSTTCFRQQAIKDLVFKQEWFHEDYVYLLDYLSKNAIVYGLNEVCAQYRVHPGGRSFNKVKAAKFRWRIYRDFFFFFLLKTSSSIVSLVTM